MHRKVLFLCLTFGVDMAKQTVNVGNNANDGSGDAARTAFTKMNQNFDDIYNNLGNGKELNVYTKTNTYYRTHHVGADLQNWNSIDKNLGELSFASVARNTPQGDVGHLLHFRGPIWNRSATFWIPNGLSESSIYYRKSFDSTLGAWWKIYDTGNTTIDGNGYLKTSSPVVRLYADQIECINEAIDQGITFEKLGVGDYLVKNTTGLRISGWYIETPRDSNGNVLVFVEFTELDNKDISVKTFKKKFDIDTASIVADHDKPMDIPQDRWIDLRFNDYPTPKQPTLEATV